MAARPEVLFLPRESDLRFHWVAWLDADEMGDLLLDAWRTVVGQRGRLGGAGRPPAGSRTANAHQAPARLARRRTLSGRKPTVVRDARSSRPSCGTHAAADVCVPWGGVVPEAVHRVVRGDGGGHRATVSETGLGNSQIGHDARWPWIMLPYSKCSRR